MFEVLFELLAEFVLQLVGEILVEVGWRSLAAPFQRESSPWLAAVGYAVFGAVAGAASVWLLPQHMVGARTLRVVNVALAPIAAGAVMAALGAWRFRRGQVLIRLDRFWYGYLFALAFALVRFFFAH